MPSKLKLSLGLSEAAAPSNLMILPLKNAVSVPLLTTCNLCDGLVVPIPTFLLVLTANATPPFCIKLNPTLVNVPTEDAPPVLPKYI